MAVSLTKEKRKEQVWRERAYQRKELSFHVRILWLCYCIDWFQVRKALKEKKIQRKTEILTEGCHCQSLDTSTRTSGVDKYYLIWWPVSPWSTTCLQESLFVFLNNFIRVAFMYFNASKWDICCLSILKPLHATWYSCSTTLHRFCFHTFAFFESTMFYE